MDNCDPWASEEGVKKEDGRELIREVDPAKPYSAVIVCVAHEQFKHFDFQKYAEQGAVIFDAKNIVDRRLVDGRL